MARTSRTPIMMTMPLRKFCEIKSIIIFLVECYQRKRRRAACHCRDRKLSSIRRAGFFSLASLAIIVDYCGHWRLQFSSALGQFVHDHAVDTSSLCDGSLVGACG